MRQVFAALEATPERGREFAAAVRHVLAWEDAWGAWKQAHCPKAPLELPPSVPPPGAAAAATQLPGALGGVWRGGLCDRVGAGGAMGAAQQFSPPPRAPLPLALTPTRHPHAEPAAKRRKLSSEAVYGIWVGTDELDRLWNLTEDNLSGEWVGCPVCGGVVCGGGGGMLGAGMHGAGGGMRGDGTHGAWGVAQPGAPPPASTRLGVHVLQRQRQLHKQQHRLILP